jgi:hypothetical protein
MKTPIDPKFFLVKYSLEFFVVVLGITVSLWLSEWNEDRKLAEHNIEDTYDLLEDMGHDADRLAEIYGQTCEGEEKVHRLLRNIESYRDGSINYDTYVDSIISIGYVYVYGTFFMNNASYKTLIQNGRLQLFPHDIEKKIKDYYEYVSKRAHDNNRLVDEMAVDYYSNHHPYCLRVSSDGLAQSEDDIHRLFENQDMRENYSALQFYSSTLSMGNTVELHKSQINIYTKMRNEVDSLLRIHIGI